MIIYLEEFILPVIKKNTSCFDSSRNGRVEEILQYFYEHFKECLPLFWPPNILAEPQSWRWPPQSGTGSSWLYPCCRGPALQRVRHSTPEMNQSINIKVYNWKI